MHLAPVKSGPLQVLVLFISPPPQVTEQEFQSLHWLHILSSPKIHESFNYQILVYSI